MTLKLNSVGVMYGSVTGVESISLEIPEGGVVGIMGPNGAGKTSLIAAVMGLVGSSGQVTLNGVDISRSRPNQRSRLGISYVPGSGGTFGNLTVQENVQVAAGRKWRSVWDRLADAFPLLETKATSLASSLSGGQRQTVSIARALATSPKYILLDEPSMGLSPIAVKEVIAAIESLSSFGLGVLIAEQNVNLALDVSSMCHVMQRGLVALSDTPDNLRANPEIQRLYLGRTSKRSK
jgi:branched-chain amino acid transport system ATP-binding protein